MHGDDAALDGGAGAEGNEWHFVCGTEAGDSGYFVDTCGIGHGQRRAGGVVGGVSGVGVACRRALVKARAE